MIYFKWRQVGLALTGMVGMLGLASTAVNAAQHASEISRGRHLIVNFLNIVRGDVSDRGRGSIGGSRPVGDPKKDIPICIVNPGDREIVWGLQPLFLLRGNVAQVAVQPLGAEEENLWNAVPTPTDSGVSQASYDGNPLQPGGNYVWEFYESLPDDSIARALRIPFQVMEEGEDRDRIATELEQLQTDLKTQGADADAIAQAQADYFFTNDLWADALQQLFSVETPSPALVEERTALVEEICLQELQR